MSFCQQDNLYAAEAGLRGEQLPTLLAAQDYVDELRELPYWISNFSDVKRIELQTIESLEFAGLAGSIDENGVAPVGLRTYETVLIIHEIAHVLAKARYGSRSHDPWFCRTYLELLYLTHGSELYAALKDGMDREGVDYNAAGANPAGRSEL